MLLKVYRIRSVVALGHRRTLSATKGHGVFHRHTLIHQASGVGVVELVGMDMASADLLGGGDQGPFDVDVGYDYGTWAAVVGPYNRFARWGHSGTVAFLAGTQAIDEGS